MASIYNPTRGVYTDDPQQGQAAMPLPAQAKADLNTAAALPDTQAKATVQPPTGFAGTVTPTTLNTANPVQPAVMPVAAPAAAAAAAAPTAIPDPNLQNARQQPAPTLNAANPVQPTTGASQIPGTPMPWDQAVATEKARYAALPISSRVSESLNYYGGKGLDAVSANTPAFTGAAGGAAAELSGLARANSLARASVVRPVGPNVAGANFGAQADAAAAKAAGSAAPEAQAAAGVAPEAQTAQQAAAAGGKTTTGASPGKMVPDEPYVPPSASMPPQGAAPGAAPGAGPTLNAAKPLTAEEQFAQDAVARAQKAAADRAAGRAAPAAAESAESAAPGATKWGELTTGQKAARLTAGAGAVGAATAGVYESGTPTPPPAPVGGTTLESVNANPYTAPASGSAVSLTGAKNPYGVASAINGTPAAADAAAPANLNDITRVGNSYSGTNITGMPTINGQTPGGGTVSGGSPTPEQAAAAHAATMKSFADDHQHYLDMQNLYAANRGPSMNIDAQPLGMSKDEQAKFHEDAALNWAKSKGDKTMIEAAKIPVEARLKREETSARNTSDLTKTLLTTQAENARAAATDATARRGQDTVAASAGLRDAIALSGQKSVAQTASDRLDFDKEKQTAEYKRQVIKDGKDAADYQWKTRKDTMDDVIKMATEQRPYINGQPDKEGGVRDAQAVQASLDNDEATLRAAIAKDPTNTDLPKQLDKLKKYGAMNYDQAKIGQIITGSRATNMANEAQTQNKLSRMLQGIQGSGASTAPFEGLTKVSRPYPLPDIYVETDRQGKPKRNKDGGYTRSLPAAAVESDSGILGSGLIRGVTDPNLANIMH